MSSEHQPLTVDAIQFQDIAHTQSPYTNVGHSKDISIDIDSKDNDGASLLGHEPNGPGSSTSTYSQVNPPDPNASFYTLAYYRRFFDVNTHDIGQRLLKTLIPSTKPFYEDEMKPDLYGPFWIATTLFILMAVTGNLASYIEHDDGSKWQYDFDKVTLAATLFYCCISILPILIWFGLRRADQTRGLVEVISIHGYALAPYIPAALISTVPVNLLRWIIVGVAFGLSSLFFLTNLWRDRSNKKVFPVVCVLIGINAVIALICKLYFFGL